MYRKKSEILQITLEDFMLPFGGKLSAENRWVKLSTLMPWDLIEDIYAKNFRNDKADGRPPIPARIAFGALHIQAAEHFTDEKTLENISENPYLQYFLGVHSFQTEPLFDLSMMVHFRKRFSAQDIAAINEELYHRTHPPKDEPPKDGGSNDGKLVLDATAAPADVRYPTDLSLLNECRENVEKLIDSIWETSKRIGHKTSYSRKKARKQYLKVAKQRKPKRKVIRQAVAEQLNYVERSLANIDKLLTEIPQNALTTRHKERLEVIRQVAAQQREHADNPAKSIPNRIVNLRQPHVRPIVRGKAGHPVEFGQKLAFSVVNGFTFIDEQSWDSFNEGITLIDSAKKYKDRFGCWPEVILADTIYRNRGNRRFCKEHGIRLSGPRLGRPKAEEIESDKEQAYRDSCERNIVESRNGIAKRRYGLDRIFAYLDCTAKTEAALIVFAMNAAMCLRTLLRLIVKRLLGLAFPAV
ncbi:MAG: IS5 family transposase [Lachnospiraceae bacterium]